MTIFPFFTTLASVRTEPCKSIPRYRLLAFQEFGNQGSRFGSAGDQKQMAGSATLPVSRGANEPTAARSLIDFLISPAGCGRVRSKGPSTSGIELALPAQRPPLFSNAPAIFRYWHFASIYFSVAIGWIVLQNYFERPSAQY